MTRSELWTKFFDCGQLALPASQVAALFEKLMAIETVAATADLTQLLEAPAARSHAA
jgi:hypothetical protein